MAHRLLRHDAQAGQDSREPLQDHGFGGMIGGGDRTEIRLGAGLKRPRTCGKNGGRRGRNDAGELVEEPTMGSGPADQFKPWQVERPRCITPARRRHGLESRPALTAPPIPPPETFSMSAAISLDALDLAALLCSRVCHDLISPTGAIVNGLEVLEEEDSDEETKTFALDLIKRSAKTASARLQFCRLAFGAAGAATAKVDLGDAQAMAQGLLEDDKTKLVWKLPRELLPKN